MNRRDGKGEIADRFRQTAEHLIELTAAQLRLARLELLGAAKSAGVHTAEAMVFGMVLAVGYGCLVAGTALALARSLGTVMSLLLLGGVHIAVAGLGLYRTIRALRRIRMLDRSRDELGRSVDRLANTATQNTMGAIPPSP